jgi:hypothetical protein
MSHVKHSSLDELSQITCSNSLPGPQNPKNTVLPGAILLAIQKKTIPWEIRPARAGGKPSRPFSGRDGSHVSPAALGWSVGRPGSPPVVPCRNSVILNPAALAAPCAAGPTCFPRPAFRPMTETSDFPVHLLGEGDRTGDRGSEILAADLPV